MLVAIAPLARTPDSQKSASALQSYLKQLERAIDATVPWQKTVSHRGAHLRRNKKIKPGEVVVILDSSDPKDHSLFSGAKTIRE